MKRGITVERKYDHNDIPCIVIKKKRGKLALDEIQDILRFEDYQQWNGQYVLFLSCSSTVRKPRWGAMAVGICWMNRPVIR